MRVAILIRKWALGGGNERVAVRLARLLLARGFEVKVLCQKVELEAREILPPGAIHQVSGLSFDPALAMLSYAYGARRIFSEWRARGVVDVGIGFNHSIDHDVYRLGGGTQAEFLAIHERAGLRPPGGRLVNRAASFLERRRMIGARRRVLFVAPSIRVREELCRHYGVPEAEAVVVPNGVDLKLFTPLRSTALDHRAAAADADAYAEGEEQRIATPTESIATPTESIAPPTESIATPAERITTRRSWGVNAGDPVALFVGQDLERKGFRFAVEASARAGVRLVYVGPDRLPPEFSRFNHVVAVGERKDMAQCYRASDVLILPSHYDPFGGVVLEAYASGLPVVATDRIGATELAKGSSLESLLVEDPADVGALKAKLESALVGAETWREVARSVAEGAGLERWGDRMVEVLRAAAST